MVPTMSHENAHAQAKAGRLDYGRDTGRDGRRLDCLPHFPIVMKTLPLLLGAAIAATPLSAKAPEPEPQKMTLLVGFCFGFVIGVAIDACVIIAVSCTRDHSTNAPPPTLPPPPLPPTTTNAPPTNNVTAAILKAGDAAAWYQPPAGFVSLFSTTIETQSSTGEDWHPLYVITSWQTGTGSLVLVQDPSGNRVMTNFGGDLQTLALPMPGGPARNFRLKAP